MTTQTAPDGLGPAGRALWAGIVAELGEDWHFDARELTILAAAARQADTVADLERALADDGLLVRGSRGQSRLHPAAIEVRHPRLALARLLGDVRLPADDQEGRSETAASQRASHAAQARWSKTVTNAERERRLCGA